MNTSLTLSQPQTAEAIGMKPRAFNNALPQLIRDKGFPPPYIGDLNNGRNGPRRRWLRAAVVDWVACRSQAIPAPIPPPANDPANDIAESSHIHY